MIANDTRRVAEALVREYLKHAGLHETIKALDVELPRTSRDISSRNELAKALGVVKVVQRYRKAHPEAAKYPSTLEIWVESNLDPSQAQRSTGDSQHSTSDSNPLSAGTTEHRIDRDSRVGRSKGHRLTPDASDPSGTAANAERRCSGGRMVAAEQPGAAQGRSAATATRPPPAPPTAALSTGVLELEDCDEDDEDSGCPAYAPSPAHARPRTAGVGLVSTASPAGPRVGPSEFRAASRLLLGRLATIPDSWKQGLAFCSTPGLTYGLVQLSGGPCGVLAAVQALLLSFSDAASGPPELSEDAQVSALCNAITFMLWQSNDGAPIQLLLPAARSSAHLTYDQLQHECQVRVCSSKASLAEAVRAAAAQLMEPSGWGVVLLVLSLVLSKGVDTVKGEMDDLQSGGSLIVNHAYCSQELVNLCLSGRAASHVHDGVRSVDGLSMKGIDRTCRVGLLTLFEWFKHVDVGSRLKHPECPIWVVCSESHFSVLFSSCGDVNAVRAPSAIDVHYYDGLARQAAPLHLTLRSDVTLDCSKVADDELPPLECVTRTKWPAHRLDWNGNDPIL